MKRRTTNAFSLSFLDVMFCGFGAVVLLVLIINTGLVKVRDAVFSDLRAEVIHLESQRIVGEEHLQEIKNSIIEKKIETKITQGESATAQKKLTEVEDALAALDKNSVASKTHINQLQSELKSLERGHNKLLKQSESESGDQLARIQGRGERQYLTGLKLSGKHTLILLDASASMLDETVINIIRRRNLGDSEMRNSEKWKRSQKIARWLIANLNPESQFQIYFFNTETRSAIEKTRGKWLATGDNSVIEKAIRSVEALIPAKGTSLYQAFASISELKPQPDNLIILTDGLPTQGKSKPILSKVSAKKRLRHFENAATLLPSGLPVNTILMPMEGDVFAPVAFWKLAISTQGSFLTPSRDWP